jgi:uncharacterized protein YnzC (UPF0291/DUF896 family)
MITPEKLDRINALSRKSKTQDGLNPAEAAEQAALRREYIDAVKASLAPQLERIRYVEPDGTITNPQTGEVEGVVLCTAHEEDDDDDDDGDGFAFPPLRPS